MAFKACKKHLFFWFVRASMYWLVCSLNCENQQKSNSILDWILSFCISNVRYSNLQNWMEKLLPPLDAMCIQSWRQHSYRATGLEEQSSLSENHHTTTTYMYSHLVSMVREIQCTQQKLRLEIWKLSFAASMNGIVAASAARRGRAGRAMRGSSQIRAGGHHD